MVQISLTLWSTTCILLIKPILCDISEGQGLGKTATKGNSFTETTNPLLLTLSSIPDLDVTIGELRDENDRVVDSYPFISASGIEASFVSEEKAKESFMSLKKSEEAASLDNIAKERPTWLLFHLKEAAITHHVLKNVSLPQYNEFIETSKNPEQQQAGPQPQLSERRLCTSTPLHRDDPLADLAPADLQRVDAMRFEQFSKLKDKFEAGGHTLGYFDALEWMACPALGHAFMAKYMELASDFEVTSSPGDTDPRGQDLVKKWMEKAEVLRNLQQLVRGRRAFVTSSPIIGAVWILKASATQALRGMHRLHVPANGVFGLLGLCAKKCHRLFSQGLNEFRNRPPKESRLADSLRLFLYHHQHIIRTTEASLERLLAGLILRTSDVCKGTGEDVACSQASQFLSAPVDPEDPQFSVPENLQNFASTPAPNKERTGHPPLLHRSKKGKQKELWLLEFFTNTDAQMGRGLLALRAMKNLEIAIQWLSFDHAGTTASTSVHGSALNPYLVCQTLWTRARELQAGSEAFTKKVEEWQDGGDKLGAVFLSLLQSQPKWGIPEAYAPLTSACMQTAGFLHSIVEDYDEKVSLLRSIGRTALRTGAAIFKRLINRKHRIARYPRTWVDLEVAMQPASAATLADYRGSLQIIYNLAAQFRKRFLAPTVMAPIFLKQIVAILLGFWAQRFKPTFSFAIGQISSARKTFLLSAVLHEKGLVGFAVDLVMEAAGKIPGARAIDIGRVSYVGNYDFHLTGAVVALSKRGRLQLAEANLEDFFIELAAASDDPVDVIRMAVDLANTLLALRESQKGARVLSGLGLMQTEAAIRYHCSGIRTYLINVAKADLVKETPETYQDYLNALFGTVQVARISQVELNSRKSLVNPAAQLHLSCPFMSNYIDADKRKERQGIIFHASIGGQGSRAHLWHKITKTKVAFVPLFTPIAAAAWLSEKVGKIVSKKRFEKLHIGPATPQRTTAPIDPKLMYLFAESREFRGGLFTHPVSYFQSTGTPLGAQGQVLDGQDFIPREQLSGELVVNAGNVLITYTTLKRLGYHGGMVVSERGHSLSEEV